MKTAPWLALSFALLACGGTVTGGLQPLPASGTWNWGSASGPSPVTNTFEIETGGVTLPAGIRPGNAIGETSFDSGGVEKLAVSFGFSGPATAGNTWNLADPDQANFTYQQVGTTNAQWKAVSGSVLLLSVVNDVYTFEMANIQMVFDDGTEPTPSTPRRTLSGSLRVQLDLN